MNIPPSKTEEEVEKKLFLGPLPDLVLKLSHSQRLERAWQLIEKDYSDSDLDLEKAARVSGISKNHLNVLLRQATTLTFHQLLVRYRLLQAITMMKSKNFTILDIAMQNGFGSLNAFQRSFSKVIGDTPSNYRKE